MSSTNSLKAFLNIVKNPSISINPAKISSNRINNVGDALESYVKDAYAGTMGNEISDQEKDEIYSNVFSWLGNSSNPPDFLIRNGDGVEVKKTESKTSGIALNSSFPKDKMHSSDSRVASGAKKAENWESRDIVYAIGTAVGSELKRLWLIYGECYAANREVYEKLISTISMGVNSLEDVEFHTTNELAKVKKVDPLGITDLRVRGMWHIQNPSKLYSYLLGKKSRFQLYLLLTEAKYQTFPEEDRNAVEKLNLMGYKIQKIKIRDPKNPARQLVARFLSYEI